MKAAGSCAVVNTGSAGQPAAPGRTGSEKGWEDGTEIKG